MAASTMSVTRRRASKRKATPAETAIVGLLRTADAIRRQLAAVMEPFGITGQQYNVLRILRGAHPEPLPTLSVGERMMEQTPGITRLLDRLEAKGLVTRTRCTEDRRQVLCSITAEGTALLQRMDEPVIAADARAMSMLNRQQMEELNRLLQTIQRAQGSRDS